MNDNPGHNGEEMDSEDIQMVKFHNMQNSIFYTYYRIIILYNNNLIIIIITYQLISKLILRMRRAFGRSLPVEH